MTTIYREHDDADWITDDEAEARFADLLDEIHEGDPIRVAGIKFSPSRVLRECDPIAYDIAFADYVSDWEVCEDGELCPEFLHWRPADGSCPCDDDEEV